MTALRGGASIEDRSVSLSDDVKEGNKFIRDLKPNIFLIGNHEVRVFKIMDSPDAQKSMLAENLWGDIMANFKGIDCKVLPYDIKKGWVKLGKYKVGHGYCAGIGAVRKTGLMFGNSIIGHIHRPDTVQVDRYDESTAHSIGCLCDFENMDYCRTNGATLKWKRGWGYGIIHDNGDVDIFHAIEHNGRISVAKNVEVL